MIRNTLVAALTSVSMDHMQYLGNTLGAIAGEKAGIFKPGCRAVCIEQEPEAMEVIRAQAQQLQIPLTLADGKKQQGCAMAWRGSVLIMTA